MKKVLFNLLILMALLIMETSSVIAQKGNKINWLSFEQAVEMQKKAPKKIMVDVYTNWCGWCKKMESSTFQDPVIVKYINENYYAVKLDAEMKDTVRFKDKTFVNPNLGQSRSTHQLAASLLNNKLSYPTTIFLDENVAILSPVQGYLTAKDIEPMLKFYAENQHQKISWDQYVKTFSGDVK